MKKRILFIAFSLSTLMAVAMPGKNSLKSTPQEMDKFVTMGHRTKRFFQWSGKMGERL